MRLRTLLLFLQVCALCTGATAQTYRLQSLDGTPVQMQVRELSDSSSHALAIVCGKDTVFAYNYWAPGRVKVVNKRFLQVTYAVRGGSNLGVGCALALRKQRPPAPSNEGAPLLGIRPAERFISPRQSRRIRVVPSA